MWLSNFHNSGSVRLADAEIVAPSSYHSDGRAAQAPLTTAVSAAIAHGSSNLPREVADDADSAPSATGSSTTGVDMIAYHLKWSFAEQCS